MVVNKSVSNSANFYTTSEPAIAIDKKATPVHSTGPMNKHTLSYESSLKLH